MSAETLTIDLEEEIDLLEDGDVYVNVGVDREPGATEEETTAEEEQGDQGERDALDEIITRFGGDPAEWDKTHDESHNMFFQGAELRDASGNSITQQVEEQGTPEQVALHHAINETWSRDPEQVQLVEYKEETETGHILHVTALWLEDGSAVASETWSREVKEETEGMQGEQDEAVSEENEQERSVQAQEQEDQEPQGALPELAYAERFSKAQAEIGEENDAAGDTEIETPVLQEAQGVKEDEDAATQVFGETEQPIEPRGLLAEENIERRGEWEGADNELVLASRETLREDLLSEVEPNAQTEAIEDLRQEAQQEEISPALHLSPFWAPILNIRMDRNHETGQPHDADQQFVASEEEGRDLQEFFSSLIQTERVVEVDAQLGERLPLEKPAPENVVLEAHSESVSKASEALQQKEEQGEEPEATPLEAERPAEPQGFSAERSIEQNRELDAGIELEDVGIEIVARDQEPPRHEERESVIAVQEISEVNADQDVRVQGEDRKVSLIEEVPPELREEHDKTRTDSFVPPSNSGTVLQEPKEEQGKEPEAAPITGGSLEPSLDVPELSMGIVPQEERTLEEVAVPERETVHITIPSLGEFELSKAGKTEQGDSGEQGEPGVFEPEISAETKFSPVLILAKDKGEVEKNRGVERSLGEANWRKGSTSEEIPVEDEFEIGGITLVRLAA